MNGDDQGPTLGEFNPSWMEDGGGVIGGNGVPDFSGGDDYSQDIAGTRDVQQEDSWRFKPWDTDITSNQNQSPEDFSPAGSGDTCMTTAGDPPGTGTWILGSVDGTCQWIDTTTCP